MIRYPDVEPGSKLQAEVLTLLEASGIPVEITDRILNLIRQGEKSLAFEGVGPGRVK